MYIAVHVCPSVLCPLSSVLVFSVQYPVQDAGYLVVALWTLTHITDTDTRVDTIGETRINERNANEDPIKHFKARWKWKLTHRYTMFRVAVYARWLET